MYKLVYNVMTNEAEELIADQFLVVADIYIRFVIINLTLIVSLVNLYRK